MICFCFCFTEEGIHGAILFEAVRDVSTLKAIGIKLGRAIEMERLICELLSPDITSGRFTLSIMGMLKIWKEGDLCQE